MSSNIGECHRSEAVLIYEWYVSQDGFQDLITHGIDKFDAGKIYVMFGVFIDNLRIMNGFWFDILMA